MYVFVVLRFEMYFAQLKIKKETKLINTFSLFTSGEKISDLPCTYDIYIILKKKNIIL